jgi:hypothetical protein
MWQKYGIIKSVHRDEVDPLKPFGLPRLIEKGGLPVKGIAGVVGGPHNSSRCFRVSFGQARVGGVRSGGRFRTLRNMSRHTGYGVVCHGMPRQRGLEAVKSEFRDKLSRVSLSIKSYNESWCLMSMKEAYKQKIEAGLDLSQAKMLEIKARVKNLNADARIEAEKQAEHLEKLLDATKVKIKELNESSDDSWEKFKDGVENAWNTSNLAIKNYIDKFKD